MHEVNLSNDDDVYTEVKVGFFSLKLDGYKISSSHTKEGWKSQILGEENIINIGPHDKNFINVIQKEIDKIKKRSTRE